MSANHATSRHVIAVALLVLCTCAGIAAACDYTVRDIGFVNFDNRSFTLLCIGPEASLEQWKTEAAKSDELKRWHIQPATRVATSEEPGYRIELVNRTGRRYLIDQGSELPSANASIDVLRQSLSSPTLTQLQEEAATSFAQIILVRASQPAEPISALDSTGDDTTPNPTASSDSPQGLDVATEASSATKKLEPMLPRPISLPVRMHEISSRDRAAESLLMWAAGIDEIPDEEAVLIVVYGRGRLAGQPLVGEAIRLEAALRQLALVGESCECDTSRDWTQLPQLPLLWSDQQSGVATSMLGFDPEADSTIAEVQDVLSRGRRGGSMSGPDRLDQIVDGYFEGSLVGSTPTLLNIPPGRKNKVDSDLETSSTVIQGDGWGFDDDTFDSADSAITTVEDSVGSLADVEPLISDEPSLAATATAGMQDRPQVAASAMDSGDRETSPDQDSVPDTNTIGSTSGRIAWVLLILSGCLLLLIPFRKSFART